MLKNKVYQYIKDGEDAFCARADMGIEQNRKGNFKLIITDKDEKPLKNAKVCLKLSRIDFNFGANIFMLGEYDSEEKNRLYEEKFCKIFNSAAAPLYWEGTEPKKGYLRYAANTKRDCYRRPPMDFVRDFCKKYGLHMKGHPLFWHEFVPQWLPDDFEKLKPFIVKRFEQIAESYKDDFECFDVVNEPSRIYDVYIRDRYNPNAKYILCGDDYLIWTFDLANRLFPAQKLILNDTVGAAFEEYRGKYSGFYLNIKDLLNRGARIDEIGMQCHLGENGPEKVYNSEILYDVLDTYSSFGKTINISEISIPSEFGGEVDEELQALAAERLYKACFSHPSVTGITWWNLPDDGVLTMKRIANNENIPSTGLIDRNYKEKLAYKVLDNLINNKWSTNVCTATDENGIASFRGFYGVYDVTVQKSKTAKVSLKKSAPCIQKVRIK